MDGVYNPTCSIYWVIAGCPRPLLPRPVWRFASIVMVSLVPCEIIPPVIRELASMMISSFTGSPWVTLVKTHQQAAVTFCMCRRPWSLSISSV